MAHPDDEVIGCGGTLAALAAKGLSVCTCILSGGAKARSARPETAILHSDMHSAHERLGISNEFLGDFPNIQLTRPRTLNWAQFIENAIVETKADLIFTHSTGDLNDDHLHTSKACQVAARLSQRRAGPPPLRALYFMEILSSTEWAVGRDAASFIPNAFFEIGEDFLQLKIEALSRYRGVMRDFPHPRSEEAIRGLAAYRGCQAGLKYAEAFHSVFTVLNPFLQGE